MSRNEEKTAASRIFYPDGRVAEFAAEIAYLIWLAGPGTAIRVSGDNRPVMGWEYYTGVWHEEADRSES